MMVDEPPYDLVAVFADADAKILFEALIERAQKSGLIRPIRWRSIRDPRRDAFRVDPVALITPFRREAGCRFMFSWDHVGSGREELLPSESEEEVRTLLRRAGFADDITLVVAFMPEVEAVLVPVWARTKEIVASIREELAPPDDLVLVYARRLAKQKRIQLPADPNAAIRQNPKEMLEGVVSAVQLRWSASVFEKIGRQVSIPAVMVSTDANRIFSQLQLWFPQSY